MPFLHCGGIARAITAENYILTEGVVDMQTKLLEEIDK